MCREYLTILSVSYRFRQILKKIIHTKQEMGKTMRAGAFALTEAKYAAGEFGTTVLDSVEAVRAPPLLTCSQLVFGEPMVWREALTPAQGYVAGKLGFPS